MPVDKNQLDAVKQWIKSEYPSLHASSDWVHSATEYVASSSESQPPKTQDLLKGVGYQLLHADLAQLRDMTQAASARIEARCQVDQKRRGKAEDPDFEMDQIKHGVLAPTKAGGSGKRAKAAPGEMLVEITAMTDVGVPAQTLLEVTISRQQALKTESGRIMLAELMQNKIGASAGSGGVAAAARSRSTSPTKTGRSATSDPAAVFGGRGGADDELLGAEEDMMRASIVYPRSMLLLELDDGFSLPARRKPIQALEMERIPELSLDGTPLGTKITISNAVVRDGVIMLKRENVAVIGGGAIEYEERAEEQLLARLREQLGLPPDASAARSSAQAKANVPLLLSPMKNGRSTSATTSPASKGKRKAPTAAAAAAKTTTRSDATASKKVTQAALAKPEVVDLSADDVEIRNLLGDGENIFSDGPIVLSD